MFAIACDGCIVESRDFMPVLCAHVAEKLR